MLYTTASIPQQITEILQQLLLDLTFVKQKLQKKSFSGGIFFTPSRFLQEIPFIKVAKYIFSTYARYTGEELQKKFLEIPRKGTPVLPGCLFSTYMVKSISNDTSWNEDLFIFHSRLIRQPEIKVVLEVSP